MKDQADQQEKEALILDIMQDTKKTREEAEFLAALELGEITGDLENLGSADK